MTPDIGQERFTEVYDSCEFTTCGRKTAHGSRALKG